MKFDGKAYLPNRKQKQRFIQVLNDNDIFPSVWGHEVHIHLFGTDMKEIMIVVNEYERLRKTEDSKLSFSILS